MPSVTYEYISAGSPVVMHEKVNGWIAAEYIAYLDRGQNNWILYPRRCFRSVRDVPFTKKTVPVRRVVVLPKPKKETKEIQKSSPPSKQPNDDKKKQITLF